MPGSNPATCSWQLTGRRSNPWLVSTESSGIGEAGAVDLALVRDQKMIEVLS